MDSVLSQTAGALASRKPLGIWVAVVQAGMTRGKGAHEFQSPLPFAGDPGRSARTMLLSRLEGFLALGQVEGGTLSLHHPEVVPVVLAFLQRPRAHSSRRRRQDALRNQLLPDAGQDRVSCCLAFSVELVKLLQGLPALCKGGLQRCRKQEGDKRTEDMAVHRSTPSLLYAGRSPYRPARPTPVVPPERRPWRWPDRPCGYR